MTELGKLELKQKPAGNEGPHPQGEPPSRGRDAKLQALGRQAVSTLYMLVRNVRMYDPDNDIFVQPLDGLRNAINTIIAVDGQFQLNAINTVVYINDKQLPLDFSALENVRHLTEQFKNRDVGGFNVSRPVQLQELKDFIWIFSPQNDSDPDENGAKGRKLTNIKVGRFQKIVDALDKQEGDAIDAERKVDRKKYSMMAYARAVYYMRTFVHRLTTGGQLPSMAPASKLIREFVDISAENRSHFLGMTTTRSVEDYLLYHSVNSALISIIVGQELGMERTELHELGMAALFHDIGMAKVDEDIVNKKRQLTKEERRVIDLYPLHTVKTLLKGRMLDMSMIKRVIAAYEAKVDYSVPMQDANGNLKLMLPKVELGIFGRIISIVACYDALTSARPFREAYGPEVAMTLMVSDMKYKFDPWLLKVFMSIMAIQPVKILDKAESTVHLV